MDLVNKEALLLMLEADRTACKGLKDVLPKVADNPEIVNKITLLLAKLEADISTILRQLGVS